MLRVTNAFRFDSNGYYLEINQIQIDENNAPLLPSDCTIDEPKPKEGYWLKWNGKKWVSEKKPTSCAECIEKGLTCVSNGQGQHNYEVKLLLESLVAADSERYKIVVSSDFVESIEEIPPKTLTELKSKKLAELSSVADNYAQYKCPIDMYITSSAGFKVDADVCSQTNMQGLILMLEPEQTCQYKDFTNEFRTVTREQLETMVSECKRNGLNLYNQKFKFEAQINACTSQEEINAIEIRFEMLDFTHRD